MLLGYVRVSTIEQNEARQIEALKARNVERIYIDKQSGKDTNRPKLNEMLEFAREGDTVITESISRIARNTRDLLNIIDELNNKGVSFVSLKENIDTNTPTGKFMLTVFAALAELERESILTRQREGIEIAKENGVYKGKPPMKIDEAAFAAAVAEWRNGSITAVEAMRRCDLKPNTFYRRVKERGL
jgi:DNA invertase Pin-like site-specific DNA recombinase